MTDNSLYAQLKRCVVECRIGEYSFEFLPADDIKAKITPANIKAELLAREEIPPKTFRLFKRKPKIDSEIVDQIVQQAPKTFAILALIDKSLEIKALISEGFTDEDLPLTFYEERDAGVVVKSSSGWIFESFWSWDLRAKDGFRDKQWLVYAPVLDASGQHYEIDPRCPIPITKAEEVGRGSYSTVYACEIHLAHQTGFKVRFSATHPIHPFTSETG